MILKERFRKWMAWCLVICFVSGAAMPAQAAQTTADLLRLEAVEGTARITTKNGRQVDIFEKMKLHNGYHVKTDLSSYAYVSLDNTKVIKLDSLSEVEIRKQGKSLEVLLISGALFFNVTAPLQSDENLNIRTSTTVTGIRGTSGVVKTVTGSDQECIDEIQIWEGTTIVKVENPLNGEVVSAPVSTGQTAISTVTKNPSDEQYATITMAPITPEELPGFATEEISKSEELSDKMAENGYDVEAIQEQTEQRLAEDEAQKESQKTEQDNQSSKQDTVPVFSQTGQSTNSGGSDSDNGSGSSTKPTSPATPTLPEETTKPTEPTKPAETTTPAVPSSEVQDPAVVLTMAVGANEINQSLSQAHVTSVTVIPGSGSNQLNLDSNVTVPAGKQLILETGVNARVTSGTTLQINGTMTVRESLDNRGTINNTSTNTLDAQGGIINAAGGTIENTGRMVLGNNLVNKGELNSSNRIELGTNTFINEEGTAAIEGWVIGAVDNKASMTLDGTITGAIWNYGTVNMEDGKVYSLILSDGSFEMEDGVVEDGIKLEGQASYSQSGGAVTVTGGDDAIHCNGGTVTIAGGTVTSTGNGSAVYCNDGTVTVSGGTINGGSSAVYCANGTVTLVSGIINGRDGYTLKATGGDIKWKSPAKLRAGDTSQILDFGTQATFWADDVNVDLDNQACFLASNVDGIYEFTSFETDPISVLLDAQAGDVIQLLSGDLTIHDECEFQKGETGKPVTLDLNGNELIIANKLNMKLSGNSLQIQNGDIHIFKGDSSDGIFNTFAGTELYLKNIKAKLDNTLITSSGLLHIEGSEIELNNSNFNAIYCYGKNTIIKNSSITADSSADSAHFLVAAMGGANKITLENSTLSSEGSTAVKLSSNSTLTVTGDTLITGKTATKISSAQGLLAGLIVINGSTRLNLEGGKICGEGTGAIFQWNHDSVDMEDHFPKPDEMLTEIKSCNGRFFADENEKDMMPTGYWRKDLQDGYYVLEKAPQHRMATPANAELADEILDEWDEIYLIDDVNDSDPEPYEPDPSDQQPSDPATPSNARLSSREVDSQNGTRKVRVQSETLVYIKKEDWEEQG